MRVDSDRDVAALVRRRRRDKAWTQQQLAEAAGLRRATVSDVEGGRSHPTFATVAALLAALDVRLDAVVRNAVEHDGPDEAELGRKVAPRARRVPLDTVLEQVRRARP